MCETPAFKQCNSVHLLYFRVLACKNRNGKTCALHTARQGRACFINLPTVSSSEKVSLTAILCHTEVAKKWSEILPLDTNPDRSEYGSDFEPVKPLAPSSVCKRMFCCPCYLSSIQFLRWKNRLHSFLPAAGHLRPHQLFPALSFPSPGLRLPCVRCLLIISLLVSLSPPWRRVFPRNNTHTHLALWDRETHHGYQVPILTLAGTPGSPAVTISKMLQNSRCALVTAMRRCTACHSETTATHSIQLWGKPGGGGEGGNNSVYHLPFSPLPLAR